MNLVQGGHCLAQLELARKIVGVIVGVGGLQMLWCRRGFIGDTNNSSFPAPGRCCEIIMDHVVDDEGDSNGDIFIYRGGRAPQHITHVLIDKSINEIEDDAFYNCQRLVQVETHDGIRRVGKYSFYYCTSLRRMNLKSVVEIDENAFDRCVNLESVEFGDRLETIGYAAFSECTSLKHLKLPSIVTIGNFAFGVCKRLTDIEFSERLETIETAAFWVCERLQRIVVPLKRDLFEFSDNLGKYTQFERCGQLTTVDLVGGIHKTIASLHMESWRTEMIAEINQINEVLPTTTDKTDAISLWMEMVIEKMDRYKSEHNRYVKEGITLLELALWKAKLGEKEDNCEEGRTKKAKVDSESARTESRMLCGADMVIKNVLPFLQLEE